MKTDDLLKALFVTTAIAAILGVSGVGWLVFTQLYKDFGYDPVAHDLERTLALLWRLIDLVAERCGR